MGPSGTGERTPKADKASYKVERFGPYEVHQRLGLGGMATVHLAMERGVAGFERWVALKRLLPHLGEDDEFIRSFVREAQLASKLSHPNVVKINQLGKVGEDYFISMEYIEGRDVRALLRQARKVAGPPPLTVTASLLMELLDALDYAHRKTDDQGRPLGLVHRDISPSNLLVNVNGHLKIIDFGIAKATSQKSRTQTGKIKGKLAYISPEVLRGKHPDARSDLFSVGIIAHELLTARPLFASKNDYKTIQRIQNAEVLPPSSLNTNCPAELDAWVIKALTKDRDQRWSSAREMLDSLSKIIHDFHLHATSRDVASWVEWAFSLPIPDRRKKQRPKRGTVPRAPTLGEGEEELLDIIWGTHGGPKAPLNLDEIAAQIAESRDVELETDPASAAPTSLLFPIGPEFGHSDASVDEGWNKAVTIAAPDRIGVEIESEFESTEPNGLVGPGDAAAFGTIDLSADEDWLTDAPAAMDMDSALFSESELTALSEPLGGGPDARTEPVTELPDLSEPKGNFDDTEPQDVALPGPVVLPPPVMSGRAELSPDLTSPSTDSQATVVRPADRRVRTKRPPSEEPPTRKERPSAKIKELEAKKAEPVEEPAKKKTTTLRGLATAKPPANPVDVVLLEQKKTKKRITARTTVPPLPEPEEPSVTVAEPPSPPARITKDTPAPPPAPVSAPAPAPAPAPAVASPSAPTVFEPPAEPEPEPVTKQRPAESPKPLAKTQLALDQTVPPSATVPKPVAQNSLPTPKPLKLDPANESISPVEPTGPAPSLDGLGPNPIRARHSSAPPNDDGPANTVTEPAGRSRVIMFLISLAFLSLVGSVIAIFVTRGSGEASNGEQIAINSGDENENENGGNDKPTDKPAPPVIDAGVVKHVVTPDAAVKPDVTTDPNQPRRRSGDPVRVDDPSAPSSARAKICIDRRGNVQSVNVKDAVGDSIAGAISSAVSKWRYEPYRRNHKPVKACFLATIKIN